MMSPKSQGEYRVMRAVSAPPEGCMVDLAAMEDGGMVMACSERQAGTESSVGSPSWHGSEVV